MKKIIIDIFNMALGVILLVGALYVGFTFTKSDSEYHKEWKERKEQMRKEEVLKATNE